jgi:hypothetical protein
MEEMQNTTEWVQANNYVEGSSITSQESEMTEQNVPDTMKSLQDVIADFVINTGGFKNVVAAKVNDAIGDIDFGDHFDYQDVAEKVNENLDLREIASEVNDYLDLDDIASSVVHEIDYSELASNVSDYIDMDDISFNVRSDIDFNDAAFDLLNQYDPTRDCTTGDKFTEAVAKAIGYLIETNALVIGRLRSYDATVSNMTDEQVKEEAVSNDGHEAALYQSGVAEDGVAIMSEMKIPNDDFIYNLLKRVVNDLVSQYVPTFNTDQFMRIRMEAKAFDIYHEMKG